MNLFPAILKFKGFPFAAAQRHLESIQAREPEQFRDWQRGKAWEMARFHYDNNDLYRLKVGPVFPSRWEDLPVITKSDLQQPLNKLITRGVNKAQCYIGSTSGSTGTPFYFAKDKYSHAMTWAVIADRYRLYGLDFGSLQARFYGIPRETSGYWKEKLKDRTMNRHRFSVFDLSEKRLDIFLRHFERRKFIYLYGYTSALVLFARHLINKGVILKEVYPSLSVCISTSELCTPEDHIILEQAFGVKHIREYGVSETCLTAFDTPDGTWRLTEETLYTEVTDVSGKQMPVGEEGDLLSTSLFNHAFPMVRYRVGDMGIIGENSNSIYRTLDSLTGRTNDFVKLPGGKTAAGLTFYYISRSVLESTGVLREFIIRQTESDHFVFDIVSDRELTAVEKQTIEKKVGLYLQSGLRVSINRVKEIKRPASGKLKHFYSEIV